MNWDRIFTVRLGVKRAEIEKLREEFACNSEEKLREQITATATLAFRHWMSAIMDSTPRCKKKKGVEHGRKKKQN